MKSFKLDEFVAHNGTVNCLRIGRNTAGVLATGGEDKKVNLWRIGQPQVVKSLCGLQSPVECVTFDSGEDAIAAGGANGTVKVWDLESGKVSRSLTGHRSNCLTLEFHPFNSFITTGSLDTNVKVWDMRRKDAITTFKGHTRGVVKLAISPDGKWVCSGSENGEIKLWDMQTGRVVRDGWSHDNTITGIEFHPNEFLMATSSTDRTVKVWDLEVWEQVESLGPEATAVRAIAYHKDGKQLLTATAEALKVWGCEPAVHYDTVATDWRNLADMHLSYKDDQPRVVGCCRSNSAVGVFLVDLRRVRPFGSGEQGLSAGAAGTQPMGQQHYSQQAQYVPPQQQRNGIGRHSLLQEPQQQQQQAGNNLSSNAQAGCSSNSSPYMSCDQAAPADSSDTTAPTASAAAGPLMRQLRMQRTPSGLSTHNLQGDKPASISKVKQCPSAGADTMLQPRQPGQLQPTNGAMQRIRRKTGDNFPEFEILVPIGPPPSKPAVEEHLPSRNNSSRDISSGSSSIPASASSSSSRRTSGYDVDKTATAFQGLGVPDATEQRSSSHLQQPYDACISNAPPVGSRATPPGTGEMPAARSSRQPAPAPAPTAAVVAANTSYTEPSSSHSTTAAAAPDPIVAAMAQRPQLKADLQRMVSALGLVKGFVARGNVEGAYKAVLSQGDAAVACMVVEALQGRQDAFELNSVEPLIKLLELLLASGHEQQQGVGLSTLSLLLRGPGQIVRDVCSGPGPVGVDLSFEQRKTKCLLVKMGLEGLGMKVGVLARGGGSIAARAQLVAEELKRVVA